MEQTNNDCRFGSSLWQVHHASNVCLLEDKIQDRGMYLFTISHGSFAVDQRSGDGWISGWSKIFVVCKRNSNARFWSTRCEDCFSNEQNHPQYPLQKQGQSGGTKAPKRGPFRSRKTDRSLDLRVLPGHWSQWLRRDLRRPILLLLIEMMMFRNSIRNGMEFQCQWRKSHLMTSWKDCTIEEYESLRSSRPYWNCAKWRFIRRKQDLIITDWRRWWKKVFRGQELWCKTTWTKNSWRLLAMGNQRAVFWRRQL